MRSLISYFIKYPIIANISMITLAVLGWIALSTVQYNFFPDSPVEIIKIQAAYPGASPLEVEQGIVYKIEDNLKGINGINRITSSSKENVAEINVEIRKGMDPDNMLQEVKNAVDKINSFPVDMEPPVVFKQEPVDKALTFALSGDVSLETLKKYAERVENDLLNDENISSINIYGYPEQEIEISLDEEALLAYNLTFDELQRTITRENLDITGGTIKTPKEEIIIRSREKRFDPQQFEKLVVRSDQNGHIIYLRDVASVQLKWKDDPNRDFYNGNPAVVLDVQSTLEEDILKTADAVKVYLEAFNQKDQLVKAYIMADRTVHLQERINLLSKNGLTGAFLVLLILALFLHYRISFWVALGIPVSFMGMFILFAWYGKTINVISLFGMIIVIGILVDDGVVISENIYRRYLKGEDRVNAAINGTMEVLPSIVSAILTTMAMFAIFFFLDGRIGYFFSDVSFVVITTLGISLIDAILILPAHIAHSKALDRNAEPNGVQKALDGVMNWLTYKIYAPVLRIVINHKITAIAGSIALLIVFIGFIGSGKVKTTFFPIIERDNVKIYLQMPHGTRVDITHKHLKYIEEQIKLVNEANKKDNNGNDIILNYQLKLGPEENQGYVNVNLQSGEERNKKCAQVENMIEAKVGKIPGAESLTFGTASAFGKPIVIAVTGNDLAELSAASAELQEYLSKNKNLKDVIDDDQMGKRDLVIKLNDQARALGLTTSDILREVRKGFFGLEAQRLQIGADEVRVWVRYNEGFRSSISNLENMRIRLAGNQYKLKELIQFKTERGPIAIKHINRMRSITIECDLSNRKASAPDELAIIEEDILPAIKSRHPGVLFSFEGQVRESNKMQSSMNNALPYLLVGLIVIIALVFRSFSQTLAVLLLIPFTFSGVIFGHFVHDKQLGILSGMGIIALIGVLVNDSLVFVSTFNQKMREGMGIKQAMYETGTQRFKPIMLTTITTVAGLSPLILEKSFQAQFLIPMAIALAYGLAFATLLTLALLPSLLLLFNDIKQLGTWLWTGNKPGREEVESAVIEAKRLNEYKNDED